MTARFDYLTAFDRNIGWVTEAEQQRLKGKRIAIAGMGGVGGVHLLTLARLGIGRFHIADFDVFDVPNFNRQVGAAMSTVGRPKVDVLAEMVLDINPEADVSRFSQAIDAGNVGDFLRDVDLYVDGLDFFAFDARELVFAACAERGIPAVTVAPAGMGAALVNFLPGSMTFEEYFGLKGRPDAERALRFAIGLAPTGLHRPYLVVPERIDLAGRKFPSTMMGCQVSAGVAGTEALKILLGRGDVVAAPRAVHFDAFRNRMVRTWRPGGHRHPMQRLAIALGRRMLAAAGPRPGTSPSSGAGQTPAEAVLDLARWAPSGDNTQCWRFEFKDSHRFVIHGFDTRDHVVYDLDGHPSQISLGALIETAAIAASGQGLALAVEPAKRADGSDYPDTSPTFDCELIPDPQAKRHDLVGVITSRSVNRRPYGTRPLSAAEKAALEAELAPQAWAAGTLRSRYRLRWFEGAGPKWQMARLMFNNAKLRLTTREAYLVHHDVIDWGQQFSADRVPDQALGVDAMTLKMMRNVMHSWDRVRFFNRFLAGTWAPRLQMDLLPSMLCGAHLVLIRDDAPRTVADYVEAGRVIQRIWLRATYLGLQQQPELTPLIFSRYVREGIAFSQQAESLALARRLEHQTAALLGDDLPRAVWIGRIGAAPPATARSLRQPLTALAWKG